MGVEKKICTLWCFKCLTVLGTKSEAFYKKSKTATYSKAKSTDVQRHQKVKEEGEEILNKHFSFAVRRVI